jgi:very-short-patch-repair endonuclease
VYAVGRPELTARGRWMAATLAYGPTAVLSHRSAAVLWEFLWRAERLILETDGRDVHTTRRAFEHDRLRDQRLTRAGFTVVRFTWRQVTRDADRVLQSTQDLLARLARP